MTACGPLRAPLTESPLPRPGLVLPRPAPGMDYRIDAGGHILFRLGGGGFTRSLCHPPTPERWQRQVQEAEPLYNSATATEYLVPWVPDQLRPIPSSNIIVGDLGRLGSDGLLHVVVTDNTTRDATVRTPKKAYSFTVGQQKHALHIVANATPLDEKVAAPLASTVPGRTLTSIPISIQCPGGFQPKRCVGVSQVTS